MTNFRFQFSHFKNRLLAGTVIFCALLVTSCQNLPRSGIDQSGDRLFESCPLQNIIPKDCNLFGQNQNSQSALSPSSAAASSSSSSSSSPVLSVPVVGNVSSNVSSNLLSASSLPGNFGASGSGTSSIPYYGSTATAVNPNIHGVNTAVVPVENVRGLRPCFEESGGYVVATGPIERPALLVSPIEQIAPVGSEVVLIASYLGKRDRLVTNEKVEWNLEGVGSFLKFDQGSHCDPLFGDFVKAKKMTERFVITKTSRFYQTLDRGTPETRDDLHILQGQTWISVNSLREGTSHVTAFSPSLSDWSRRTMFGLIHWVDAQWVVPVLPIASVGESRVLTVNVLRRTNGQPRQGWVVRYEILNGPKAGFGSTMAQIQEVTTDISGQAPVVLSQREPVSGTNTISVQIIRPGGGMGGHDGASIGDKRITVGYETLQQTWGGNAGIRVSIKGPEKGNIGVDLPYKIIVTNNTGSKAEGILTLVIPPAAVFVKSTPPIYTSSGQILYWNVELPAKNSVDIDVILRQGVGGRMMLESNFTPGGRVNISPSGIPTGVVNPNQIYSGKNSSSAGPVDHAAIAPVLPDSVTGGTARPNNAASVWGDSSVTIHGAPFNNLLPVVPSDNFEPIQMEIMVNPKTVLKVGEGFELLLKLENKGKTDLKDVILQIPIPMELRNLNKYSFTGPKDLRDNNIISLDPMFNIVQKFNVVGAGKSVTMRVGFSTLLPAGYSIVGELVIDGKLIKRTQPLRVNAN
ncbi:MAG: hypothetical protein LBE18_07325 [Planctomycetaceae bacterium]|jgi:hypothetical protein|nr:hypothetical protein [Planctomycetaceae bacterium]